MAFDTATEAIKISAISISLFLNFSSLYIPEATTAESDVNERTSTLSKNSFQKFICSFDAPNKTSYWEIDDTLKSKSLSESLYKKLF